MNAQKIRGQTTLQFLLTLFIFIVMLVFVIFAFLIKYVSFYQSMEEKATDQQLLLAQSSLMEIVNTNEGVNETFLEILDNCSKELYFDPQTKKINPYYLKIKGMLSISPLKEIQIKERRYVMLFANETIDENTTQGYYLAYPKEWIRFVINKSTSSQKYFDLLTLYPLSGSPVYLKKDSSYPINNENFILRVIDRKDGRYALFESAEIKKCGPTLQGNSEVSSLYAPGNNTLIKLEIEMW